MLVSAAYDLDTFVRFVRLHPDLVHAAAKSGIPAVALFGKLIKEEFGDLTDAQLTLFGKAVRVVAEELGYSHLAWNVKFNTSGNPFGGGSTYG